MDSAWVLRMSGLTHDGTTEPISRNQICRRERGQGKKTFFPVQLTTTRTGNIFPRAEAQIKYSRLRLLVHLVELYQLKAMHGAFLPDDHPLEEDGGLTCCSSSRKHLNGVPRADLESGR